jgi:4-hydroxy-4-methyl-2-oxoglutarate aldolase
MDPAEHRGLADGVTSASLCDAMARRYAHRCHAVGLRPARSGQVTFGPAATVRFGPRRDDLPDHDLAAAAGHALSAVPAGAVLVIAAPDAPGEAVAGGKKLAAVEELGATGVIAWGAIRDRDEAGGYGMGVWALAETPRASGDLLQVIEAGDILCFGGVTVCPGDWVYADEAGLVVIPPADVDEVLREARAIEAADAEAVRAIRGGASAG